MERWQQHLPIATAALVPLLEEAASTGAEFPPAERALFMACDFWTAVASHSLVNHLGADPVRKLRYMGIVYSAIGAFGIASLTNRAVRDLRGFAAPHELHTCLMQLEARLLASGDSVDALIAQLARTMLTGSATCAEDSTAVTDAFSASRNPPTPLTSRPRAVTELPEAGFAFHQPRPAAARDQLPSDMDYDLRRRLETFASGNCSSEVFIEELSSHCAATPDFIWDVLALIDQYQRRGKISAEFQRSVRELIERPALTYQRPQTLDGTIEQGSQLAKVAAAALAPASARPPVPQEPTPSMSRLEKFLEEARKPVPHPASGKTPVLDSEIIVPILHELRPPAPKNRTAEPSDRGLPLSQAVGESQPTGTGPVANDLHRGGAAEIRAPGAGLAVRRRRQARSVQVTLLVALFSFVTASSALSDLAMKKGPPVPTETASPQPLAAPAISLSSDRYIVYPGDSSAVIQVERTGDASDDVSFVWWTRQSGAKSGKDYRGSRPKTEHLAAGVKTLQWSIPILPNAERRHTELFYVGIRATDGSAEAGTDTLATVFVMGPD